MFQRHKPRSMHKSSRLRGQIHIRIDEALIDAPVQ